MNGSRINLDRSDSSSRSIRCDAQQRLADGFDDTWPVAWARLTEQPNLRVPGTVLAGERPSPVGRKRQQHPGFASDRACEMDHGGVDRDRQIGEGGTGGGGGTA